MPKPTPLKKIFIDFDGVIHRYDSRWTSASEISDPPVTDLETGKDAIQWLTTLLQSGHFELHIFSRRGADPKSGGISAMQVWLAQHGLAPRYLKRLKWVTNKPDYFMIIDDRALGFDGHFPMPHDIQDFKPWNKKK